MKSSFGRKWVGGLLGASAVITSAQAVTIQIVADNDFAVYAGTSTSITREIYQNGVVWNTQLSAADSFSFDLIAGESVFYLLAMGGGGQENISGKINGTNIVQIFQTDPGLISVSNGISSFLSLYSTASVTDGTYTPSLSSVQSALTAATWGTPTVISGETVINGNPEAELEGVRRGFDVPDSEAVFFRFGVETVGVPTVPEPSSLLLLGMGFGAFVRRRRSAE